MPAILTFSIITLSPTTNGKFSLALNPTERSTVTSLVTVLNPTVLIPTPLEFLIGRIDGVELLIPLVLLRIVTLESPREYLAEISVIWSPVFPSKNSKSGADEYPLPPDVISMKSIFAKESTLIIWGKDALGFKVPSDGKSYPISSSFTCSIVPISLLTATKSAFTPSIVLIEVTDGNVV